MTTERPPLVTPRARTGLALLAGLVLGVGVARGAAGDLGEQLAEVDTILRREYLYPLDAARVRDEAIAGAVLGARLAAKDPYSRYLTPAEARAEDAEVGGDAVEITWSTVNGVAVIAVPSLFQDDITARITAVLGEVRSARPRPAAVIIDLRGNTGGYLDAGVALADAFISTGILATEEAAGARVVETWRATASPDDLTGMPLAVLIDAHTASAAEIAAAALDDLAGAVLVGERTRGKGRVQSDFDLQGGGRLILTVERWRTPRGADVQGVGISPDVAAPASGALDAALGALRR